VTQPPDPPSTPILEGVRARHPGTSWLGFAVSEALAEAGARVGRRPATTLQGNLLHGRPAPAKGIQPCCRRVVRSLAIAPAADMVHRFWPMIRERGGFCINVLAHDQEFVSARLAAKGPGKLEGLPWRPSPNGSPILGGAIAWIDARLESEHPAGDHLVVISRVLDLAGSDAHPLIFFRGKYRKLAG